MSTNGDTGSLPKRARRSRLFRSRPDALLVDEWVPDITLPPPPDEPLEADDPAQARIDEHGLPRFDDEPEERAEARAGPARLFVGLGQRGPSMAAGAGNGPSAPSEAQAREDFFVAELRLPRPEDRLPFRLGGSEGPHGGADDDEVLLDAAEASDADLAFPELDGQFSVSLEAPDPLHLGSFGDGDELDDPDDSEEFSEDDDLLGRLSGDPEDDSGDLDGLVSGGLPPLTLQPSPARLPLADRHESQPPPVLTPPPVSRPVEAEVPRWAAPKRPEVPAAPPTPPAPPPETPAVAAVASPPRATVVLRTRPFWTRDRLMPEPKPASAPVFQPRSAPEPAPIREKIYSWPVLGSLLALLLVAGGLWVWQLLSA